MNYTADWHRCYEKGWKGIIVDEAFAHPAKYAFGLIERIITHGLEVGWWKPGDLIGDPFGGIGTGGIMASYNGLRWVGVELEARFGELAVQNFGLHRKKWAAMGDPEPVIIHGDSLEFAKLVGECGSIVCSPPFQDQQPLKGGEPLLAKVAKKYGNNVIRQGEPHQPDYGHTPGQIGALKEGEMSAIVSSPPYAEDVVHGRWSNAAKEKMKGRKLLDGPGNYGTSTGQIGIRGGPQSYWQAVRDVYEQCRIAMKPGGWMVLVVKDYVKKGARVPLCDDTIRLCESLGFIPRERIRAWLVKSETNPGLFGDVTKTTERKSFFRRLAEKKGSPRIDFEEVLVFQT